MRRKRRHPRGPIALFLAAALTLGACNSMGPILSPPHFDQATEDGLKQAQTDAHAAFAQLRAASPPDCLASANVPLFDKVTGDLSTLQSHVGSISNNTRTQNGVAALGQSFQSFRQTDLAATSCLPAQQVSDQQAAIDAAVNALVAYEDKKPKGP